MLKESKVIVQYFNLILYLIFPSLAFQHEKRRQQPNVLYLFRGV